MPSLDEFGNMIDDDGRLMVPAQAFQQRQQAESEANRAEARARQITQNIAGPQTPDAAQARANEIISNVTGGGSPAGFSQSPPVQVSIDKPFTEEDVRRLRSARGGDAELRAQQIIENIAGPQTPDAAQARTNEIIGNITAPRRSSADEAELRAQQIIENITGKETGLRRQMEARQAAEQARARAILSPPSTREVVDTADEARGRADGILSGQPQASTSSIRSALDEVLAQDLRRPRSDFRALSSLGGGSDIFDFLKR